MQTTPKTPRETNHKLCSRTTKNSQIPLVCLCLSTIIASYIANIMDLIHKVFHQEKCSVMKIMHLQPSSHFLTSSRPLPLGFSHTLPSLSLCKHESFFAFVKKVRNSLAAHEENHRTFVTLAAFIIGKQASVTAAANTAGFTGTQTEKKPTWLQLQQAQYKNHSTTFCQLLQDQNALRVSQKLHFRYTTGSRTECNCLPLKFINAASLEKEQNPVSSLVLRYQEAINKMTFVSGNRINKLIIASSGILCPWVT